MNNYYCKMFVNAPITKGELAHKISSFLGISFDKFLSAENDIFTIDIQCNKEFNETNGQKFPDGFLFYPYFVETDIVDEKKELQYKTLIKCLMDFFWAEQYQVVASCDFEEELPFKGGYNQPINKKEA
ncbi:hypothetical protein RCS94_00665 [Orbaceae bacterium ac157xtp]